MFLITVYRDDKKSWWGNYRAPHGQPFLQTTLPKWDTATGYKWCTDAIIGSIIPYFICFHQPSPFVHCYQFDNT